MKIAIATDAWHPQVNGVVRTLDTTIGLLQERGFEVACITPDQFLTLPMPGYSQIRLALAPRLGVRRRLSEATPDVVHIVTEGPIGWSARKWCLDHEVPFTTAFHTRFPDYAAVRTGMSPNFFWPVMRRFHRRSEAVFVSTVRLREELENRGIAGGCLWSRGIDVRLFSPGGARHPRLAGLQGPILLSVGRIAAEKNLEAFLRLDVQGTKVVVGDGPLLATLRHKYPGALFMGNLSGEELASAYRAADVFVFPSLTDTFGMVMIEALASGLPVAGFPVPGPLDIVGEAGRGPDSNLATPVGALDKDLAVALRRALMLPRDAAARHGASYDWNRCTDQFIAGLDHACGRGGRRRVINHV
jgi:glycosyltransferase involved in cell wall biosynthesis